jgi:hypothetical protein
MPEDAVIGNMAVIERSEGFEATSGLVANGSSKKWPDWKVDLLKRLWRDGFTAAQIATRLGVTRNAVVGKRWRLGLDIRQQQNHDYDSVLAHEARDTKRRIKRAAKERQRRRNGAPSPAPSPGKDNEMIGSKANDDRIPSLGIELNDLKFNGSRPSNCRAIISPDRAPKVLYCGLPVWGSESYCIGHCRKYLNKFNPNNIPLRNPQRLV